MDSTTEFVETSRRIAELTQQKFAMRSSLCLRFIRELEQGQETVREGLERKGTD